MRIKLDENLPASLRDVIAAFGHDVDTVPIEGCQGADDEKVWAAAQQAGRLFVTQDMDFSDLRRFVFGVHSGIVVVRLREPSRITLRERLQTVFGTEDVESWAGCFIIVTDHKVRVRKPRQAAE
ncbi:MAG: DUF5615 family PIN-like protein [Armatimonadota bacterium]|nr:DUF5615 family PIN-like protein [Armatimonadota bacterium]